MELARAPPPLEMSSGNPARPLRPPIGPQVSYERKRELADERTDFGADLCQFSRRYDSFSLGSSPAPVEALDLVRQDSAPRGASNQHLEGIAFDLRGHGTAKHETCLSVVGRRAEHNGGAVSRLLMPRLRVEVDPHNVACIGHIGRRHHQASLPTALPKSTSSCKFSGVIPFRSSERVYSLRRTGSMTIRPHSSRTSTESSKRSLAACRTAAGMRTEALLPHFLTTALIGGTASL